jgi:peptidylprolyl isomerase
VPNQKQRREAARRHLERQLQARQARDARRKKVTLITSIVGTLVLIAAIIVVVVVATGGDDKKSPTASKPGKSTPPTATDTSSAAACDQNKSTKVTAQKADATKASFDGVTISAGATDLRAKPVVTSKGTTAAKAIAVKDLVVGKGAVATPTSCVEVQYLGVLYKNGKEFDSSWSRGATATFPLTGVVPGFTKGIGGDTATKIAPMHVGGRRIIIVPAVDGYGAQAQSAIPANSDLVFIVDLTKIDP